MTSPRARFPQRVLLLALLVAGLPDRAGAVLDIEDQGPVVSAGGYALRVTNAGILGNAFFDNGRSSDPSFETPPGSGVECLNYAALWVGGRDALGTTSVSGGPLLEFRPTLDPEDRVRIAEYGRLGARRLVDDDGDGRVDEEILNGRDDDGDGEVDEDLGLFSQRLASCDYVDDRPEAVNFVYANGEQHRPLGISVHQEVYAWSVPGFDRIAGITFTITNHSNAPIRDVLIGLYADLDSRQRNDRSGHLNDRIASAAYSKSLFTGMDNTTYRGLIPCGLPSCSPTPCFITMAQRLPVLMDGDARSGLPAVAVVPLDHSIDPLANFQSMRDRDLVHAPAKVGFRSMVFQVGGVPGQGGAPQIDVDRYAALAGDYPVSPATNPGDYAVLVSCGPFPRLAPGEHVEFSVALVTGANVDSLETQMGNAALLEGGLRLNRRPDDAGASRTEFDHGVSGINGHEVCLMPPAGVQLVADPDCGAKFPELAAVPVRERLYPPDRCLWTDADCDGCTGIGGVDTVAHWYDPGTQPPGPGVRVTPLDHRARVEWDNAPEVLLTGGVTGGGETRFIGYRVWKLADWRDRTSLVPDRNRWSLVASFGADTLLGSAPLSAVTNDAVDYERILYEQRLYPVGRYRYEDPDVLNGFDYIYAVSTVYESRSRDPDGFLEVRRAETPIDARFSDRIAPRAEAPTTASSVHVVPNPFRAHADWDRPATIGDPLTRHVDFVNLPRAFATIRVWTLAGDLVAQLDHDGRGGDGEAPWNLVSRNGQDVASGVYLFTVDSSAGRSTGRFVVIR